MGSRSSKKKTIQQQNDLPISTQTKNKILFPALKSFCKLFDLENKGIVSDENIVFIEQNGDLFQEMAYKAGDMIYNKGERPKGLFFILEGEVSMLSEERMFGPESDYIYIELMSVGPRDFFCDVEVVYGMDCLAHARSLGKSTLCLLPVDQLQGILLSADFIDVQKLRPAIETWFIERCYLPPNDSALAASIDKTRIYQQICTRAMRQISLFYHWDENLSEEFISQYLNTIPVTLYPRGSVVLEVGDKFSSVFLLIKGKLQVFDQREKPVTVFQAQKFPFVFGEESVFSGIKFNDGKLSSGNEMHDGKWKSKLQIITESPIYILEIQKDQLFHASKTLLPFQEEAEKLWRNLVTKWSLLYENDIRTGALYEDSSKHSALLQMELQYQALRRIANFSKCARAFVYDVAKWGRSIVVEKLQQVDLTEVVDGCYCIVLTGAVYLVIKQPQDSGMDLEKLSGNDVIKVYEKNEQIIYEEDLDIAQSDLVLVPETEQSLILKVALEDIEKEFSAFPGSEAAFER